MTIPQFSKFKRFNKLITIRLAGNFREIQLESKYPSFDIQGFARFVQNELNCKHKAY